MRLFSFPHSIKPDVIFAAAHLLRVTLKAHKGQHRVQGNRLEGLDDMQSFAVFSARQPLPSMREEVHLFAPHVHHFKCADFVLPVFITHRLCLFCRKLTPPRSCPYPRRTGGTQNPPAPRSRAYRGRYRPPGNPALSSYSQPQRLHTYFIVLLPFFFLMILLFFHQQAVHRDGDHLPRNELPALLECLFSPPSPARRSRVPPCGRR